jgi:glucose/arabinose dehydrogenase
MKRSTILITILMGVLVVPAFVSAQQRRGSSLELPGDQRSPFKPQGPQALDAIQLEPVLTGLSTPVFVTNAHDGSNRLFIVELFGLIKVVEPDSTVPTLFLDISTSVLSGGEQGLLGLAFHPDFPSNRRFFVNYTRKPDGATVIAEYKVSASNPNVADPAEKPILTIAQPFANHNGGMIEFGEDGFLYIGMGDGGSGNDPGNRAQNINELLGKILRIDIDHPNGAAAYSSPADNPFFGATAGRDEIYAVGMRNPFRFSFDRGSGQLFCGDVGQGAREEIDIITLGGNYGWRVFEGTLCTPNDPPLCATLVQVPPITEYGHTGGRCSVTGGYVYNGPISTLPVGTYVFADFCTGEIFRLSGSSSILLIDTSRNIASFGEDEAGEIYVAGLGGTLDRLTDPAQPCAFGVTPEEKGFPATGGSGNAVVTARAGCNWNATPDDSWITITNANSGSGRGVVRYSIAPNISFSPRVGSLTIAGKEVVVTQEGLPALGEYFFTGDFDSDDRSEIGFYRGGLWGFLKSGQSFSFGSPQFFSWGGAGLLPILGDFDGDNKADIGHVVPPAGGQSAVYSILKSTTGYSFAPGQVLFVPAGFPSLGDTPIVGDFDGDGKSDPGIWRASQGVWIIPRSSTNFTTFTFLQWGQLGDIPIVLDFDNDNRADIGFYRDGLWGILQSSQGYSTATPTFFSWGGAGIKPIIGDFDGDGHTDIGQIVAPAAGQSATYSILKSSTGYSFDTGQVLFVPAGFPSLGDTPVVGDWDGDGKADPAIWRASQGIWIIPRSSTGFSSHIFVQWGQSGDIAQPNTTGQH